jgi:primosomal replication protein N
MGENKIVISGVASSVAFHHEAFGIYYYQTSVAVTRRSGNIDYLDVVASDETFGAYDYEGKKVVVHGAIRSRIEKKQAREAYVAADNIEILDAPVAGGDLNKVEVEGFICNKNIEGKYTPVTRRYILNLFLAIHRNNKRNGRADYIPCCIWGENAKEIEKQVEQGSKIKITGMLLSRELYKNGEFVSVSEISVNSVEVLDENNRVKKN